ncbi:hypothetical protein JQ634_28455 [Bradyrhizobium sp. AUGA SZCCT0240]|jgi:hypothetical protein|uniref:hypothetical protein n=1 Tax=unclassified Bradyrhizobium TaxID=2631580 RepID=UPI001BAAADD6|nr:MULTISPECIES: hypothetical protein [unclassified Bradyrhizobium]MBR1189764.1 hypothetical protein [Bradyrhizobium sp. AUGA SZCCT0160]MBR1198971.1 hypothetical protein [Bradyrhizobium sp. AUGA SZCCT0158]MBR1239600.1 hypothetical protein [Bradyrhizobium sp. AUGA SZCCT0274]MBR1247072.1 hypothetical protein [Bradyrhizobium sp. AUGA SZCCT0169]MBR1257607.1 hypothetical protein [Bradyrhizobium sp. AUGA SZCCT0240]
MKKSDTNSQKSADKKVEAPVQLKPEQLEAVAGGMIRRTDPKGTGTTTTGAVGPKTTTTKLTS